MKKVLILLLSASLVGCLEMNDAERISREQRKAARDVVDANPVKAKEERISVRRVGLVDDDMAYNRVRGIYVIRDNETGVEYIGVSGIGVAERGSHTAGKNTHQDER